MNGLRLAPLALLVAVSALFEPVRSGFFSTAQGFKLLPTAEQLVAALANLRHLVGYGLIALVGTLTFPRANLIAVGSATLLFCGLLELQQSMLASGHRRTWDMIPNAIGITVALAGIWKWRTLQAAPR